MLMSEPSSYRLSRYLKAKQTVDERSLNRRIEQRFYSELADLASSTKEPLSILDLGAGHGPTAKRLVRDIEDRAVDSLTYHLVDQSSQLMDEARTDLREWMEERGYEIQKGAQGLRCSRRNQMIAFSFHTAEAAHFLRRRLEGQVSSVIAQSFLDLTEVTDVLELLHHNTRDRGVLYFPLTFDGGTRFLPKGPAVISDRIIEYYHESMQRTADDEPTGGAQTGAQLLEEVPNIGSFLEVGSSDWLVYPQADDGYTRDEAYFLHHILHFVENELSSDPRLSSENFSEWLSHRRRCIEQERLIYQANQLDVLARVEKP